MCIRDSLNAFDLKDFDYDKMDNLKINSEDEFSVWSRGQTESYEVASVNLDMFALDDVKTTYQDLDNCINDSRSSDLCPISQLIRGHAKRQNARRAFTANPSPSFASTLGVGKEKP